MADNAFISAPSGMSNAQQGTRGLSAGDWVRLKRLRGARSNGYSNSATSGVLTPSSSIYNKDIVPPQFPQQYYLGGAINVFSTTGTSKIRRTASNWTDYIASQTADYVLTSQAATTSPSVTNTVTKLCNCATPTYSVKKLGICTKCNVTTHVRIM
jgi:hypothetical protein